MFSIQIHMINYEYKECKRFFYWFIKFYEFKEYLSQIYITSWVQRVFLPLMISDNFKGAKGFCSKYISMTSYESKEVFFLIVSDRLKVWRALLPEIYDKLWFQWMFDLNYIHIVIQKHVMRRSISSFFR